MNNSVEGNSEHDSTGLPGELYIELPIEQQKKTREGKQKNTTNIHSMVTQSKSGAKHILMMTEFDQDPSEPTNVDEALKRPEWVTAMKDELEASDRNEHGNWSVEHLI